MPASQDQIASLDAQIARAEGEQLGHEPDFSGEAGEWAKQYVALRRRLYAQRVAQYQAQINSFDQKISQTLATIKKAGDDKVAAETARPDRQAGRRYALETAGKRGGLAA